MKKAIVIATVLTMLFISTLLILPAIKSWNPPASIIDLAMAVSFIMSAFCWFKAISQLSDEGQDNFWRIMFWSKLGAGQENFTPEGWLYWLRLRYSILLLLLLFISRSVCQVWK